MSMPEPEEEECMLVLDDKAVLSKCLKSRASQRSSNKASEAKP